VFIFYALWDLKPPLNCFQAENQLILVEKKSKVVSRQLAANCGQAAASERQIIR